MIGNVVTLWCMSAAVYAGLFAMGWWLRRLLGRDSEAAPVLPAGLFGLVVIQISAWYWTTVVDRGLDQLWTWLLVACAAIAIACIAWARPRARELAESLWRTGRVQLLTVAGSIVLFTVHADELLARATLTIGSSNSDVAVYALTADHLSRSGTSSTGWVMNLHLGDVARTDVHGAISFVAFAHWLIGSPYFRLMLAVLAVTCALLSQACAQLIRTHTSLSEGSVVALALVPQSCFLFVHVAREFFLSQLIAMALVVALASVVFRLASRPVRQSWRGVLTAGLLLSGILLAYPHMAFLAPPILAAVTVLRDDRRVATAVRAGVILGGGFVLACVLLPTRLIVALDRLRELSSTPAGYALEGFTPWAIAGFQSSLDHTVSFATIILSVLILGVCVSAVWRLRSEPQSGWELPAAGMIVCGLGSYALFYFFRGGPTYSQWKWVSFLQPLIVLGMFAPLTQLLTNWWRGARGAACATLLGLLAVLNINSEKASAALNTFLTVSPELGELGRSPALDGIDVVNIRLPPYWDTMWASQSLAPRTVYGVSFAYWGSTAPGAEWTVVQSDEVPPDTPSAEVRPLNDLYSIVRRPSGPTSATGPLSSIVQVSVDSPTITAGQPLTGTVRALNDGASAWLGAGSGAGAVTVGVRDVDAEGIPTAEVARIDLRVFPFTVSPGQEVESRFSITGLAPGVHRLEFTTVSELVAWFTGADHPAPVVTVTVL